MNNKTENQQIEKIAHTLMYAFKIHPDDFVSNNDYILKESNREATEEWVKNTLLNPNEKLASCVLPILIEQFEQHLRNF